MDAELAALIEEQKRQAEMLRALGLLDDDEAAEQPAEEAAEFDQAQHQEQDEEEPESEAIAAQPAPLPTAKPAASPAIAQAGPAVGAARLELFIYSTSPDAGTAKPATLRQASGRVFMDYGNRVYATDCIDDPEGMAADLLDIAKAKEWHGYTLKGAAQFAAVYRAAFSRAIVEGLRLIPDHATGQGAVAIEVAREYKAQGEEGKKLARSFLLMASNNEVNDERRAVGRALLEKLRNGASAFRA